MPGARLLDWGAHTVDLCQWANRADDTLPVEYEPSDQNIVCRYADGTTLILDFLKTPFGDRGPNWNTKLGTCPVRFRGTDGWVFVDRPGLDAHPTSLLEAKTDSEVPSRYCLFGRMRHACPSGEKPRASESSGRAKPQRRNERSDRHQSRPAV